MANRDSEGVDEYHSDVADAYLSRSSEDVVPTGGGDVVLPLAKWKSALWDSHRLLVLCFLLAGEPTTTTAATRG